MSARLDFSRPICLCITRNNVDIMFLSNVSIEMEMFLRRWEMGESESQRELFADGDDIIINNVLCLPKLGAI